MMVQSISLRRLVTALALGLLIAPVQSAADDSSPTEVPLEEPYQAADDAHGHGEEAAGGLIFEQFIGEKIYIQDKGEVYVVVETVYEKSSHEYELEFAAELSVGLTDRLQFVAELPYVVVDPDGGPQEDGLGDVTLGLHYNFVQESGFSWGVRSGFVLPSGNENRGLGGGHFVWEPNLLGAVRVGSGEIYGSVGGEISGGDPDAFTYTVSGAYPWASLVGVLELGGSVSEDEQVMYLAPGSFWNATDFLQVGLGVPVGLSGDADDFQIVGALVFEF